MKTELLIQMDGLRGCKTHEQVFVMAASNCPWDLDIAVLRRLEKRVLVPLPEFGAREVMLRKHLIDRVSTLDGQSISFEEVARLTEGYSGADIELLCRESAMKPVRRLMDQLSKLDVSSLPPQPPANQQNSYSSLRRSGSVDSSVDIQGMLKADPVTSDDIASALETTKSSSIAGQSKKYEAWQNGFGNE